MGDRYVPPPLPNPAYIDLSPKQAAPRLGMSRQGLWAFLRRHERDGRVDLGGGVWARRFGARRWRVRFPEAAASPDSPIVSEAESSISLQSPQHGWLMRHPGTGGAPGRGMLPRGEVAMLSGEGGVGKTTALVQLAISVATGLPWLGHFVVDERACGGRVLVVLGIENAVDARHYCWRAAQALHPSEDECRMVQDRVLLLALDWRMLRIVERRDGRPVAGSGYDWLRRKLIEEAGDGWALIVLDPLCHFVLSAESRRTHARLAMQLARELTTVPGSPTVLLAHYSSKAARRKGLVDVRGVSELAEGCQWIGYFRWDDGLVEFTQAKSDYSLPWDEPVMLKFRSGGALRVATGDECHERAERKRLGRY